MNQIEQLENNLRQVRQNINSLINQIDQELNNAEQMISSVESQLTQQNNQYQGTSTYYSGQYLSQPGQQNLTEYTLNNRAGQRNQNYINPISGLNESQPTMTQQGGINNFGAQYSSDNDYGK